jgi:hypothetical protein
LEVLKGLDQRVDSIAATLRDEAGMNPVGRRTGKRQKAPLPPKAPEKGIQESSRKEAVELLELYEDHKRLAKFSSEGNTKVKRLLAKLEKKTSEIKTILEINPSDQTEEEGAAAPASLEVQQPPVEVQQPPVVARPEEHAAAAAVPLQQQEAQQHRDVVVPIPPSPQEEPASKRRRQMGEYVGEHKGIAAYAGAGATAVVRVGPPLFTNPVTFAGAGMAYGVAGELARRTLRNWPQWKQRQRKWAKVSGGAAAIGTTVGGVALFGPAFLLFPIAPALIGTAGFGGALAGGSLTAPQQPSDVEMGGAPEAQPQVQPPPQPPVQNRDPQMP